MSCYSVWQFFFLQKSFESIFWQCASNIRASYWFSLAATFFAMMNLSESEWLHMIEIILIAKMLHCTKRIVPTQVFMASYFHQRKVHSREILRIYVLLLGNNSSLVIDGVECSKSYFMDQMSFKSQLYRRMWTLEKMNSEQCCISETYTVNLKLSLGSVA